MMINQNNNTLDQEELLEAFRTFDGDDKGYIFSNEIRYVMRHMGESIPEQDINEILQDHQQSHKRKITFEGMNQNGRLNSRFLTITVMMTDTITVMITDTITDMLTVTITNTITVTITDTITKTVTITDTLRVTITVTNTMTVTIMDTLKHLNDFFYKTTTATALFPAATTETAGLAQQTLDQWQQYHTFRVPPKP